MQEIMKTYIKEVFFRRDIKMTKKEKAEYKKFVASGVFTDISVREDEVVVSLYNRKKIKWGE